jgi:hypothetical protein
MRSLALAVTSIGLLLGTSASAQISNIQADANSGYTAPGVGVVNLGPGEGQFVQSPSAGANYSSYVNIGETILFESSHAVSNGTFTEFQSSSVLSFNFAADSPTVFQSQIIPQGMGMYLADTSNGCLFTHSCVQVPDTDYTFGDLGSGFVGNVGFTFEILDNESTLFELAGVLTLQVSPTCPEGFCFTTNLFSPEFNGQSVAQILDGFEQQTHPLDDSARAFGWGSTDLAFLLDEGFHSIEYRTKVFSFANACALNDPDICLVAYSGFGDPIGRGGGIDAASAFDIGAQRHLGDELIQGLNFTPQTFRLGFKDGVLTYLPGGAIPEPGTWALMILGFGTMGAALRRRRIPAHI